jgi:hypothetical protein
MAFAVGVNSYVTVAESDTYWSDRNNTAWAGTDAQKQAALIEATQYMDGAYTFIGTQKPDYPLCWPRFDVEINAGNFKGIWYDAETIPQSIKDACCELALEALSARLDPVLDRGGMIKREKVDVIEVEYSDFAPSGRTFTFVGKLLKPFLDGGSGQRRLVRS